jgi:aryl-alcohol dehydrogenase-like predicted oxidoreductase
MQTWTFRDGRTVNRMGFGAMRLTGQPGNWGPYPDKARAERVLKRAYELGANFIDTAISYGAGHSEMLIADVLAPYPQDLFIATKGGFVKTGPGQSRLDGSRANLRTSCEASLGYLKVETLDLYQLHAVDPQVPLEESVGALAELQREGKIRRIGLCNVDVAQVKAAQALAEIVSVQNKYNLNFRQGEDVVDYCAAQQIAFLPWGPFDGRAFVQDAPLAHAGGRLAEVAKRVGATEGQVALAWLMAKGPNQIQIPGTTSVEHVEENMAAADVRLSPDDIAVLDGLTATAA